MIRVYLDTCCIQRPLDDTTQPRIHLEAEAILATLRLVEAGQIELLSSEALLFEVSRIASERRRSEAQAILRLASGTTQATAGVKALAGSIMAIGIKPMDAVHAASAIEGNADYFCTCDDPFLKRLRRLDVVQGIRFVSPLELVEEIVQ